MILSPVSCFCPGSALGRHLMGSDEEQVGQSNNAQWRSPAEMSSAWPDPSSRRRDLAPGGRYFRTARTCNLLTLAGYGYRSFVGQEGCSVGQHAVQNHGELAGERDLGLAHASASGQAHPPALQRRALDRSGQNDVGRLVEGGAHAASPIL